MKELKVIDLPIKYLLPLIHHGMMKTGDADDMTIDQVLAQYEMLRGVTEHNYKRERDAFEQVIENISELKDMLKDNS